MRTTRQDYIDGTPEDAIRAGCDCFQLKYDGWWCRLEVRRGLFQMFNKEGRELKNGETNITLSGTFIGEYMFGTNWAQNPLRREKLFLFDVWALNGDGPCAHFHFRDRFSLLRTRVPYMPSWMSVVDIYPISRFQEIWDKHVATGEFEGVVFRRRAETVEDKIIRYKRDIEITYRCTGFIEGQGKHAGRLGAVLIDKKTDDGKDATVGGGFSDEERIQIWKHPELYLHKEFDCVGKALFPSGLVRHPNFLRWKET